MFRVVVVVAPVVGPTPGGWLSDNVAWYCCFLINGPVGVIGIGLIAPVVRDAAGAVLPAGHASPRTLRKARLIYRVRHFPAGDFLMAPI